MLYTAGDIKNPIIQALNLKEVKNLKTKLNHSYIKKKQGFPGGTVVENLPANAGDTGSNPGLGRSHMPRSNWAREP